MARPAAPVENALWTPEDVRRRTGMSRTWVQEHKNDLGGFLLGGALRFERESVEAFIARCRGAASPAPTEIRAERERPAPRAAVVVARRRWADR